LIAEKLVPRFWIRHLFVAGLVIVVAMVLISFGRIMWIGYELGQRAEEIRGEIVQLEDENQQLQAELEYLMTDEAAEELAREKLGWARPGDTVLVVSSEGSEPVSAAKPAPLARPTPEDPIWQRWWQELFPRDIGGGP
jgi:cell division protein FtsB